MDSRTALNKGTKLIFNDGTEYTIIDELARGGASIVYSAFYVDNLFQKKTVRIKECYPYKCRLQRGDSNELFVYSDDYTLFEQSKQKMLKAYRLSNSLFYTDGLTNHTVNTYNIYNANHTIYIVSAYSQGKELSFQEYPSVKDSISIVKSTAEVIRRIHSLGYLFLDIKPSNILTLEGSTDLIQLFDFDSMISLADLSNRSDIDKISYTKGFAPLEQQTGNIEKIGKYSDVYGIGALLFYMIFNREPDAFDCESDTEYDFTHSKLSGSDFQDCFIFKLTEFFHGSLASYYLDRYSDMEPVIKKLDELQSLADSSIRFVFNTKISRPESVVGRKNEIQWVSDHIFCHDSGLFFVVGMGGIGKSTLIREAIKQNEKRADTILYLNFSESIERTIIDDYFVRINTIKKCDEESSHDYFERKIGILKELGQGKKCILVFDNYTGDSSDAFIKLINVGWTIIFITRDKTLSEGYKTLEVKRLPELYDLKMLFIQSLGRVPNDDEKQYVDSIIEDVDGHTLTIELIARQIGSPTCDLTVQSAAEIVKYNGFFKMSKEKVFYQRDSISFHSTIKEIISGLFEAKNLTESEYMVIKAIALFGRNGISINRFCEMLGLEIKDDILALYQQSWICIDDRILSLHPVIEEVVRDFESSEIFEDAAMRIVTYLNDKVKEETAEYVRMAQVVLDGCKKGSKVCSLPCYKELFYYTLKNLSYEDENYIYRKSEEFISLYSQEDPLILAEVYELLVDVLYEQGKYDQLESQMEQLGNIIEKSKDPYVKGFYCYLLACSQDAMLNGAYIPDNKKEINHILISVDRAIKKLWLAVNDQSRLLLGECFRFKAYILIRSNNGNPKQIRNLLRKAEKRINRYASPASRERRDYLFTEAWYYTYCDPDLKKTRLYFTEILETLNQEDLPALDLIDDVYIPGANILLEHGEVDDAYDIIQNAVGVCKKHIEILPYRRRLSDLLGYLTEICYIAGRYDECRKIISAINHNASEYNGYTAESYIPYEILSALMK